MADVGSQDFQVCRGLIAAQTSSNTTSDTQWKRAALPLLGENEMGWTCPGCFEENTGLGWVNRECYKCGSWHERCVDCSARFVGSDGERCPECRRAELRQATSDEGYGLRDEKDSRSGCVVM